MITEELIKEKDQIIKTSFDQFHEAIELCQRQQEDLQKFQAALNRGIRRKLDMIKNEDLSREEKAKVLYALSILKEIIDETV